MKENHVTVNSGKAFLLAARPKTLSGAAVPVMIGVALAIHDMGWERFLTPVAGDWYRMPLVPALLCFLFAMVMQVDANFVNDYFDCVRGKDDRETRLGPKRACTEGWVTLPAMRRCLVVTTALACLVGLPLVCFGGWEMVLVGAACVLFCFLYTTLLAQHGMGDVLVLLFFGLVPVCLTYYVTMPPASQTITAPGGLGQFGMWVGHRYTPGCQQLSRLRSGPGGGEEDAHRAHWSRKGGTTVWMVGEYRHLYDVGMSCSRRLEFCSYVGLFRLFRTLCAASWGHEGSDATHRKGKGTEQGAWYDCPQYVCLWCDDRDRHALYSLSLCNLQSILN